MRATRALSEDDLLRAARRLPDLLPIEVSPPLLAAHALPPEFEERQDASIDRFCVARAAAAALGLREATGLRYPRWYES